MKVAALVVFDGISQLTFEFESMPRVGEKISIQLPDETPDIYVITEVVHRFSRKTNEPNFIGVELYVKTDQPPKPETEKAKLIKDVAAAYELLDKINQNNYYGHFERVFEETVTKLNNTQKTLFWLYDELMEDSVGDHPEEF